MIHDIRFLYSCRYKIHVVLVECVRYHYKGCLIISRWRFDDAYHLLRGVITNIVLLFFADPCTYRSADLSHYRTNLFTACALIARAGSYTDYKLRPHYSKS